MDTQRMQQALNNCLLSEKELLEGMESWRELADPFPAWEEKREEVEA
jgi:hypothetical protein